MPVPAPVTSATLEPVLTSPSLVLIACSRRRGRRSPPAGRSLFPHPEQAPDHDELTDVVSRVVRDEEQLAKIRLPRAVRNRGSEVDLRINRELLQRRAVVPELRDALVP